MTTRSADHAVLTFAPPAPAVESKIYQLAAVLELEPGSSVADRGAQSGELSIAIARYVGPAGTVYASEIDPKLVTGIRRNAEQAGASNVPTVASSAQDTGLASQCCDAIATGKHYCIAFRKPVPPARGLT
jgi:precorrin-6B methylase 2